MILNLLTQKEKVQEHVLNVKKSLNVIRLQNLRFIGEMNKLLKVQVIGVVYLVIILLVLQ